VAQPLSRPDSTGRIRARIFTAKGAKDAESGREDGLLENPPSNPSPWRPWRPWRFKRWNTHW